MVIDEIWNLCDESFSRSGDVEAVVNVIKEYPAFDAEYAECLNRGGVHVFSNALRIFGLTNHKEAQNILRWNSPDTWKKGYASFFAGVWAFAEDVFGYQFLFSQNGIVQLDIETGELKEVCTSFGQWAKTVLDNVDYYTGCSVAEKWNEEKPKEILTGKYHLCPATLFVCGGRYELDNLFRMDSIHHLHVKSQIAEQIKNLPDGTEIEISFE